MNQIASVFLLTFICITSVTVRVFSAKLLDNFKPCDLNAEGPNECIRESFQYAVNNYPKGSKEVGVLPLDPLDVKEMVIQIVNNKIAEGKLVMSNFTINGLSKSRIEAFERIKSDGYSFRFVSVTPLFSMAAPYEIKATLFKSPVYGNGMSNHSLENLRTVHHVSGELFKRKNNQYFTITSYTVNIQTTKLNSHFDNLFNGDKELGNRINNYLKEYQGVVFEASKHHLEDVHSLIYKGILTNFLVRNPIKKLATFE